MSKTSENGQRVAVRALMHFVVALVLASIETNSFAQCHWTPGPGYPGINGDVLATVPFADPSGPSLIAGGQFTVCGTSQARNIARWNGVAWFPIGDGLGGIAGATVRNLTVFNGEIVAGGTFTLPSGGGIARWTGTNWEPVGEGVSGSVFAMTIYQNELIAAGIFPTAGGVQAANIARWNGVTWNPLGSGIGTTVKAMAVYQGRLFAAGDFNSAGGHPIRYLAAWDGSSWNSVGGGIDGGTASALLVHDGRLLLGGNFATAGGIACRSLAQWDGVAWQPVGNTGLAFIGAMTEFGGELVAAGGFSALGGIPAVNIARWNGSAWRALAGGIAYPFANEYVSSLATFQGELVAAGHFFSAGQAVVARNVARWDGAAWRAAGTGFVGIWPLLNVNDRLFGVGAFLIDNGTRSAMIGEWDGVDWQPITSSDTDGAATALTTYGGDLVVGGYFTRFSGVPATRLARWDGSAWSAVSQIGPNGAVFAVLEYNNELYVAGSFSGIPNVPGTNRIARWDGSEWRSVGGGVTTSGTTPAIHSLCLYNGELYAGGVFDRMGGAAIRGVARWDGASWRAAGGEVWGTTKAMVVFRGELVVGGDFSLAGGVSVGRIARWNGSLWRSLGNGVARASEVRALAVLQDQLIAGGYFAGLPASASDYITSWDGSLWSSLGPGVNGSVNGLASLGNELAVGGSFTVVDGVVSGGWARWSCPVTCYANCDGSVGVPILNVNDFICFQARFAANDPYANCDGSSAPPVLNVNDYVCFQARFAGGCR